MSKTRISDDRQRRGSGPDDDFQQKQKEIAYNPRDGGSLTDPSALTSIHIDTSEYENLDMIIKTQALLVNDNPETET